MRGVQIVTEYIMGVGIFYGEYVRVHGVVAVHSVGTNNAQNNGNAQSPGDGGLGIQKREQHQQPGECGGED